MKLSRRDFLKGAAAGFASVAAMGMLGSAGALTKEEYENTIPAEEWLGEAPEIGAGEIVETLDVDVLVVGDGTGGAFAAASAAEEGAKVLVIEKGAAGYGIRGDIAAINSRLAKGAGLEYDPFDVVEDISRYAAYDCDMVLVKTWAEQSGQVLDWYQDVLKQYGIVEYIQAYEGTPGGRHIHWATGHNNASGEMMGGEGISCTQAIHQYVESLGGEYRYETPMVKLVMGDGEVRGAIAKSEAGLIRINAAKGVIVCTGGYARNDTMMRALQPYTCKHYSLHQAPITNVGDGIKACLWAGADMDDQRCSMLFDRCSLPPDGVSGLDYLETGCLFWMGSQPFMKVDLNGKRFVNESCPYDFALHASTNHPGNCYCTVWDANWEEHCRQFDTLGCSRVYPIKCWDGKEAFETGGSLNSMIAMSMSLSNELGYIQKADTFEELAEKLNLPVEAFAEQANLYNAMCEEGKDAQFGKEAYRMIKLDTPPYYGVRQTGMLLCTLDGISINENMQALNKERNVIPGLYVTGNDSGGFYAHTYTNYITGGAAGRTVTFGRIAGKHICGKAL